MPLEEVIRKFTSLPASRLRLADRGVLKAGLWADIVVFDPEQITDKATFSAPSSCRSAWNGRAWSMGCRSSPTAWRPTCCLGPGLARTGLPGDALI